LFIYLSLQVSLQPQCVALHLVVFHKHLDVRVHVQLASAISLVENEENKLASALLMYPAGRAIKNAAASSLAAMTLTSTEIDDLISLLAKIAVSHAASLEALAALSESWPLLNYEDDMVGTVQFIDPYIALNKKLCEVDAREEFCRPKTIVREACRPKAIALGNVILGEHCKQISKLALRWFEKQDSNHAEGFLSTSDAQLVMIEVWADGLASTDNNSWLFGWSREAAKNEGSGVDCKLHETFVVLFQPMLTFFSTYTALMDTRTYV
jgi:hypothetical protein